MNFRTIVDLSEYDFKIDHNTHCCFVGSCFAENIGKKLLENKLPVKINSTGILYNPLSIAESITMALSDKVITEKDIFYANGLWNHYNFHSKFSSENAQQCLENINNAKKDFDETIRRANILFVSFGTSYVYYLNSNNSVVSNCHKQIPETFTRKLLSIEDIYKAWTKIINQIKTFNPKIRIVFTISPIRHWKDGANLNQLSKSILHISIHEILKNYEDAYYFPSYEIVMDELRDYRFYAEDMLHPSSVAIDYIWERFGQTYFDDKTLQLNKAINKITKAANHRVFNKSNTEFEKFCKKNLSLIKEINQQYPKIDFSDEAKNFKK